jgi:hypothetical protein
VRQWSTSLPGPLRPRPGEIAYELFLLVHILCGVGWIVGCYYHVFWLDFNDDHVRIVCVLSVIVLILGLIAVPPLDLRRYRLLGL